MKSLKISLLLIFVCFVVFSCSKDDDGTSKATGYINIENQEYVLTSGYIYELGETEEGSGVYKFSVSLSTYKTLDGVYIISNVNDPSDTLTRDIRANFDIFSSNSNKLENGNYQYKFTENSKIFNSLTLTTSRQGYGGENYYEASSCALEVLKQGSVYQFSFAGTANDSIEFNGYFKGKLKNIETTSGGI